jgi:tripartite-type tricarboxylate transporter receptor subunit TctC
MAIRKLAISFVLGTAIGGIASGSSVRAENYPTGPVTMIVPFASGGAVDAMGRMMSNALSVATKQTFVVDNRPGAGGVPAMNEVAKSGSNGQILGVGSSGTLTISPHLFAKLNFDPLRDLEPIVCFGSSSMVLIAKADLPVKSLADLIALSKKSPGSINMASAGTGSIIHLTGEYFQSVAGVKWTHVPYRGSAPALTDMIGGRVDVMTDSVPSAAPHVKSGALKALAVTSGKRSADLPDVPTLKELGYDFDVDILYGLVAAKNTPKSTISLLNGILNESLKDKELIKRLAATGFEPTGGTPESCKARIKADFDRWGVVIRQSGVEVK